MFPRTLRARLAAFWLSTATVSLALGVVWWTLVRHGSEMQTTQARATLNQACTAVQRGFGQLAETASGQLESEALLTLLDQTLGSLPGVEGGIWGARSGFIAYAFPTYEGNGVKRDVPPAEMAHIAQLAASVAGARATKTDVQTGVNQSLLSTACELAPAPTEPRIAWVMTRVNAATGAAYDYMAVGLIAIIAFVILSGLWLNGLLARWSRQLLSIETALRLSSLDALPTLPLSGDQELDSISQSINAFSDRLRAALGDAAKLAQKLAEKNRLASLGRMAAVVAHEVRNPLATIRIKAENALAAPNRRTESALTTILTQSQRLEAVVASILQMLRSFEIRLELTELAPWLAERYQAIAALLAAQQVELRVLNTVNSWTFDRIKLGQAVDNLVLNAVQHSNAGQTVELKVSENHHVLSLVVRDYGPGIAPAVAGQLFEPFVTGRADGVGLGLMVVKETVEAHHGRVYLTPLPDGTCFTIEVP